MEQAEIQADNLARRKSCILKLVVIWFGIGAVIVAAMIFIRQISVNRDQKAIAAELERFLDYRLPEGFYAYSRTHLMGVRLYTFWDKTRVREDGRTTSVIAVYLDERWRDLSLDEAREKFLGEVAQRLNKREFSVKSDSRKTLVRDDETIELEIFNGIQLIDTDIVDATASYRFMLGPDGPFYVHAMGPGRKLRSRSADRGLVGL